MSVGENYIGKKYGRLTVIGNADGIRYNNGGIKRRVYCTCDCGNKVIVRVDSIVCGKTLSCGCFNLEMNTGKKSKTASKLIVNTGDKFGELTIIKEVCGVRVGGRNKRRFLCKCECGVIKEINLSDFTCGTTVSCGCYNRRMSSMSKCTIKHGLGKHPLYKVWKGMNSRCYNKNNPNYFRYGGRGIFICDEWVSDFKCFYDWGINNGWTEGLEIDREDNNKGYYPANCRFVTSEVNNNNKRNNIKYLYNEKMLTLPQIARLNDITFPTLYRRVNENKLTIEQALAIPRNAKINLGNDLVKRKLNKYQVVEIFTSKLSYSKLAAMYNIHESSIGRIKKGKQYSFITKDIICPLINQ